MNMTDIHHYIKELNTDNIYINIEKYPLISPSNININVGSVKYGVRGTFVTNISIDDFSISEITFTIFKKIYQQSIEYIEKRVIYLKLNEHGMVSSR